MKRRVISLIFAVFLVFGAFSMTACSLDDGYEWIKLNQQEQEADDGQNGSEGDTEADEPQSVINNVTSNTVTITGQSSDVAYASALGLRSSVSVYSVFETTVISGYPWSPTVSTEKYYSTGSGVIYRLENDGDAFIVTNFHVVYDGESNTDDGISEEIYLYLYGLESDEYAISAAYVGGSAYYDIAVLKVEDSEVLSTALETGAVSPVTVGDSNVLAPGQTSIAIGNPSGYGISVTKGIVSVDSEYITMTAPDNSGSVAYRVIRIDTPINSGNSGGGLYNGKGELIGIVNAKITSSSVENIGYAIPSAVASAVADNIIDNCYGKSCTAVMRAILGITLGTSEHRTAYDLESGLLVKSESVVLDEVSEGGLAANAGLAVGDIIKSVKVADGEVVEVTRMFHFIDALLDARSGDSIVVTYIDAETNTESTATVTVTDDCLVKY